MTEKKNSVKEDDPKQSEAFRKAVRDLEAAGDLKGENIDKSIDALLSRAARRLKDCEDS